MGEANIEISSKLLAMHSGKLSVQQSPKATKLFRQEKQYEQPDLNLGLSLGGIYGECSRERLLNRSSSISGVLTRKRIDTVELDAHPPESFLSLARSSSVPAEAEKEQRRMVLLELAKRRVETMPSIVKQMGAFVGFETEKSPSPEPMPSSPSKVAAWAAASAVKSPAFRRAILKIKAHAALYGNGNLDGLEGLAVDKGAAASSQSLANYKDAMQKSTWGTVRTSDKSVESTLENPYKKAKVSGGWSENNAMDVMRHMPSVTTTGDGPDGRRIEGFLYKYRKGQVSIVCICHGSFLSPEEFVKHAGGKDVSNPMKQITVCSTPFSF